MPDPLRLWLDGQCLQTSSRMRGIGRYVGGFIRGLVEQSSGVDLHVSLNAAMPQQAVAARDFLSRWLKPENIHVWHGVVEQGEAIEGLTAKRRLSEIAIAYHVSCLRPDIAISASPFEGAYDQSVPFLPSDFGEIPTASIFYDAIPYRFRDRYLADKQSRKYYQRRLQAFSAFDVNLCISDFARQELADLVNGDCSVNIGAGVSDQFKDVHFLQQKAPREENTLLYVGGFDWRKNVPAVIRAISLLDNPLRDEVKFLIIGDIDAPTEAELKRNWIDVQLPPQNIRLIGHVPDELLLEYYRSVSAVIQPSLMEGFGLTALEAILCGTPVIAANTGALPEVIIDRAHLFDPIDHLDIARHVDGVLRRRGESTLSQKAQEHARKFSWDRTASIAIGAIRDVCRLRIASSLEKRREQLAQHAVHAASTLRLRQELVVGCLARAEPRKADASRLIIDATSTVITDGGSGIQRVVKKICSTMSSMPTSLVLVGFSNDSDEWFEVKDRCLSMGVEETKRTGKRIFFTERDHILMLDSSWTFHAQHARSLMNARIRGAQITTCLYDTVPLRASGFCHAGMPPVFSKWLQTALTYSTGFVCISQAVADELLDILKQIRFPRPVHIGFWPLGADFGEKQETRDFSQPINALTQFLMVGTVEPRKGYRVALDAFDELWAKNSNVSLTIVGKVGWGAEHIIKRVQSHPQYEKKLFWRSSASDLELSMEYAAADCLIASSFAEGFGLPIVEAGYFGKPIIASDIPVFREVSAKSVHTDFFEVGNSQALADCINRFTSRPHQGDMEAVQRWENWTESAENLREVISNGKWYHRYAPKDAASFVNPDDIGEFEVTKALDVDHSRHHLRLIDGPMNADINDAQKLIVKITNQSDAIWSSKGTKEKMYGVFVGCRLFDRHGHLISEGYRTEIPLIIAPGDAVYLPVEVPNSWLKHQDAIVHVEMYQEGVCWWGDPLALPVQEIAGELECV